ncbi:hypothetical protein [uncultured Methanospirillum sp.]|uniref:hypothetical protein n=1 Tax=uncultured Methanospirillum sp. TaxID=262503 RepID=UPI0029C6BF2D|nr:hypothetical protein [uncultured Methanospirillum sp.]
MKWPEYGIKILFRYPYSGIFRRDLHPDICACFPTLIPSGGDMYVRTYAYLQGDLH